MYAAWNGHVECVKYLASNVYGTDKNGIKCSSLNMVTTRGYTGELNFNNYFLNYVLNNAFTHLFGIRICWQP